MADGYTVAQAYIQIMPSTEKFGSAIKNEMQDEGQKAGGSFSGGFKTGLKVIGAATVAAGAAIGKLTSDAVKEFSQYEQLVGGVNKLFGEMDYQSVVDNAGEAFRTAGLSANEYMDTVTSFSASLIAGLKGDTQAAVEYADMAITDMSDNANVFGTDMQSIQNAYQGFAKQNYTMLDNLKLGYGGTKEEMERLITNANRVKEANGEMANLSIDSFADVVEAIHIMQDEMNISGTTAKEASITIQGSVNSMKSAWHNMLIGLADDSQDFGKLVDNLLETILGQVSETGERVGGVVNNILPRVETALGGIAQLIAELAPRLVQEIPGLLKTLLPALTEGIKGLLSAAVEVLPEILSVLTEQAPTIISSVMDALIDALPMIADMIPQIIEAGLQVVTQVAEAIVQNLPAIMSAVWKGITGSVSALGNNLEGVGILAAGFLLKGLSGNLLSGTQNLMTSIGNVFKGGFSTSGVVGRAIAGAVVGIAALSTEFEKAARAARPYLDELESVQETHYNLLEQMSNAQDTYDKSIASTEANAAAAEFLNEKLQSLVSTYDGSAAQSETILSLVEQLNELVPGLGLAWDGVTGSLSLTNQEIRNNIEAMKEQAQVAALQGLLTDSLTSQYQAQKNYEQSRVDFSQLMSSYGLNNEQFNWIMEAPDYQFGSTDTKTGRLGEIIGKSIVSAKPYMDSLMLAYQNVIDAQGDLTASTEDVTWAEQQLGIIFDQTGASATNLGNTVTTSLNPMAQHWQDVFGTQMPFALQQAISTSALAGFQIPQGLVDGIMNQHIALQSAVDRMNALVKFDAAVENANLGGLEVSQSFVNSWLSGEYEWTEANNYLLSLIDFTKAIEEAQASGQEVDAAFVNGLLSDLGLDGVISAAEVLGESATPTIVPNEINTVGAEVPKDFTEGMESTAQLPIDEAGVIADGIIDQVSGLPDDMNTTGSDSGSNLNEGFGGWKSTISGTVDETYNFFYNTLGSIMPGMMSTWGSNAGQKYNSGLNIWMSNISSTAESMARSVYTPSIGLPSQMYEVGYMAGQGIYSGLSAWAGQLSSLAWSIASEINAAARAALRIKSPSKVMEEVGRYTAEGLAIGIQNGTDDVIDATVSMTGNVTASANEMLDDLGTMAIQSAVSGAALDRSDLITGIGAEYQAITGNALENNQQDDLRAYMLQIMELLTQISNMQMVTDTGALVGAMAKKMDRAFEVISMKENRG